MSKDAIKCKKCSSDSFRIQLTDTTSKITWVCAECGEVHTDNEEE